jgi:hypothetical protein
MNPRQLDFENMVDEPPVATGPFEFDEFDVDLFLSALPDLPRAPVFDVDLFLDTVEAEVHYSEMHPAVAAGQRRPGRPYLNLQGDSLEHVEVHDISAVQVAFYS